HPGRGLHDGAITAENGHHVDIVLYAVLGELSRVAGPSCCKSLDLPPRHVEYPLDFAHHSAVGPCGGGVGNQDGPCHSVVPLPEEVATELVPAQGGEYVGREIVGTGLHRLRRGLEAELTRDPVFERRAKISLLQTGSLRQAYPGIERDEPAPAEVEAGGELRGGRGCAGRNAPPHRHGRKRQMSA